MAQDQPLSDRAWRGGSSSSLRGALATPTLPYRDGAAGSDRALCGRWCARHRDRGAAVSPTSPGLVGRWRRRFRASERLDGLKDKPRAGRPRRFPPGASRRGEGARLRAAGQPRVPLGRFSRAELHRLVVERGLSEASASTIWRWLHDDAFKPWQHRCWIFPRDPDFAAKAGRVLDLYERRSSRSGACAPTSTSSVPMRSPSSRRSAAATQTVARRLRGARRWSSSSTTRRYAGLPGGPGRSPRQLFDRCRSQDRDRAVRASGRAGHDQRAVRLSAPRLLDHRQRLIARGKASIAGMRPPCQCG